MRPFLIEGLFPPNVLKWIIDRVEIIKGDENSQLSKVDRNFFYRKSVHNPPFLRKLHQIILTQKIQSMLPEKIRPSFGFIAMYDHPNAICPPHVDRPQCKYTVNLCLNQKEIWPLFIDGKEFLLTPGDAAVYSGTTHKHWRHQIKSGNFCDLAFFNFVPIDFEGELE